MSTEVVVPTQLVVRTIVQTLKERTFKCSAPGCARENLAPRDTKVGDLTNLYLGVRRGPVDESYPLNANELASEARCPEHPLSEGIRMFLILDTGSMMDRWVRRNLARQDQGERERRHQDWLRRKEAREQKEKRPSGGFINSVLSGAKPKEDKPRPKHRHRKPGPAGASPSVPGLKRYGDEGKPAATADNNKKRKGKQKDDKQKKKR